MDCNYKKKGNRGLTLCVRRFLQAMRAAGGMSAREEERTEWEREAGWATVGQGGKETRPYQPKGRRERHGTTGKRGRRKRRRGRGQQILQRKDKGTNGI